MRREFGDANIPWSLLKGSISQYLKQMLQMDIRNSSYGLVSQELNLKAYKICDILLW